MQKKYIITILVWLLIVVVSIGGRDLLFDDVEQNSQLIESNSEASKGTDLYRDRFNVTTEGLTHILILEVADGQKVTDNSWRNFTLFLISYLNDSLFELNYTNYLAEPIFVLLDQQQPGFGFDEVASNFVSDDEKYGLIYITNPDFEGDIISIEEHVHLLREKISFENDTVINGVINTARNQLADYAEFLGMDVNELVMDMLPTIEVARTSNIILTGTAANFADIIEVSEESFENSEILAIILAIIILAFVFKSPLGVAIPITAMIAALFPSYFLSALIGKTGLYQVSDNLPAMIAMIGIAVAIDYNLFSLVRFREEFRKRKGSALADGTWEDKIVQVQIREEAADKTNKTTGVAVMYSGFTVIIGFLSLLVLGSDFTLGLAISVSIVVLVSILTARTLTPAILALFGHYLDWPNFISGGDREVKEIQEKEEQGEKLNKNDFWLRWSKRVMKRPGVYLLISILFMVPFITLSTQMDLSFDFVKQLPQGTESREGFEILQQEFSLGTLNPYEIILDLGETTNFFADSFSDQAALIVAGINRFATWGMDFYQIREKDDSVQSFDGVSSISVSSNETGLSTHTYLDIMNKLDEPFSFSKITFIQNLKSYINWNGGEYGANNTILIRLTSNLDAGTSSAWELVDIIRDKIDEIFSNIGGIEATYVTGMAASFKDSKDEMYQNIPLMLFVAVISIYIILMLLFRSIILPAKAIITIAGSILFGMGVLVFIFQQGNLLGPYEVFGFVIWQAETSGITFFIPAFLFTVILGLGMDYSILIISRIKEEYERTGDMSESVGIGLSKTAGVITSAAIVMISTFMVFALSPMLILKTMGVAMAVAIFIDASISRIILLPAAMKLAGKWNFWLPNWLKKILPEIKLDH
ncbi:MAG: MMPL family transporter [Candidatus Heimdallarchaeota archaeon]|nr:MMPL family transporter [Candidatus Heimdallarchaeota archaeon]MDH5646696.1 MMPL family transporter [Candidatus Heimdallarchaeota archaeon]